MSLCSQQSLSDIKAEKAMWNTGVICVCAGSEPHIELCRPSTSSDQGVRVLRVLQMESRQDHLIGNESTYDERLYHDRNSKIQHGFVGVA